MRFSAVENITQATSVSNANLNVLDISLEMEPIMHVLKFQNAYIDLEVVSKNYVSCVDTIWFLFFFK